jgi:hypothetical protein
MPRAGARWTKIMSLLRPASSLDAAYPEAAYWPHDRRERVVRAALGTLSRRWVRGITLLAIGLQAALGAAFFIGGIVDQFQRSHTLFFAPSWYGRLVGIAVCIVALICGGVLALLFHDGLIRWRLRTFARARHACAICRYPLAGTFVAPPDIVVCPECGFPGRCAPQHGEIANDEQGRVIFVPSAETVTLREKLIRSVWIRRLKKIAIRGAIVGAAVVIVTALSWEGFVRWQSQRAAALRPPINALQPLIESLQPAGSNENDPDMWAAFDIASQKLNEQDAKVWNTGQRDLWPDFPGISEPPGNTEARPRRDEEIALAKRMIETYRSTGVLAAMDAVADCPRAWRPLHRRANGTFYEVLLPELGQLRNMARICWGRMPLAWSARDLPEFRAALRTIFGLARMADSRPLVIQIMVGNALRDIAFARMKAVLAEHPDAAWLDMMEVEVAREDVAGVRLPVLAAMEGSRLMDIDLACAAFENVDRVRLLRFADESAQMLAADKARVLPTLSRTLREIDRFHEIGRARLEIPPHRREQPLRLPAAALEIGVSFRSYFPRLEISEDTRSVEAAGVRVMIALERHFLASGSYPDSLDTLGKLPIDPWSGRSFCYRVREDKKSYTLWSTAPDKADNGARHDPTPQTNLGRKAVSPGFDYVIFPPSDDDEP